MFDPELKYCPKCNDEYMPVAQTCAACNVSLLTGEEMACSRSNRKGALTQDDDVVTIHKGAMADLKHLQRLCEQENIGSRITAEGGGCGKG